MKEFKGRGLVQMTGRREHMRIYPDGSLGMSSTDGATPRMIWHRLPGGKLKVSREVSNGPFQRSFTEDDMLEIQTWLDKSIPSARRLSFDTWLFKEEKHITMFLLKWAS